jgi:transposase
MLSNMKPYSLDLRERVLAALDRGMSRQQVATTFQISLASIKRWLAARRDTGNFAPRRASGGSTRAIPSTQDDRLRAQVTAFPDATLAEHARRWNITHATSLSQWSLGRAIRRLGLPRKKSR